MSAPSDRPEADEVPDPPAPDLPDMARSYDAYFASGLYRNRYPRPNRRTMRFLRQSLPVGGRLVDFGAGEGRYCLALARERQVQTVAVDISAVARAHLADQAKALGVSERILISDATDPLYTEAVVGSGSYDAALLGFGVLGHVAGRSNRIKLLSDLRSALRPRGRLILGLPNAARRFRDMQDGKAAASGGRGLEPGDIRYARRAASDTIELFYHLYHREEIVRDLAEAGLTIERLTVESVLPERAVTHSTLLGLADDLVASLVPVDWGYGYLVIAAPRPGF